MTKRSRILAVALFAIASSPFTLITAQVAAMPMLTSLHFPQQNGPWGCSFHDTCAPKVESAPRAR